MHINSRFVFILGVTTLLGSVFFSVVNKHDKQTTKADLNPKSAVTQKRSSTNPSISQSPQQIAQKIIQGDGLEFIDDISEFSRNEVLAIITVFEQSLNGSHQESAELLIDLCSKVAETNPENALLIAGAFHFLPGIADFERKAFNSWITSDPSQTLDYLETEHITAKSHHIAVAASVFQNEQREHLSKYLEWTSSFQRDPESNQIDPNAQTTFADAVTKLTTFANENTIEDVVTFLEEHSHIPVVASNLANLLESSLMQYPEDADEWFDWLAELPIQTNEMRTMLVSSAIGGLTKHDPDKVVSLLSSQEFLDQQYLPGSETETPAQRKANQEQFFDDILAGYLQKNIQYDPEAALIGAQAFHDQERRRDIEEWAKSIIRSDTTQNTP